MTQYVTVYVRTVVRRKTKRRETRGCTYTTKSLTPMHEHIRKSHPGAQTWKDPKSVTTDFVPGWNLGILPIVCGGERIG